jgi:hypothetical protein
LLLPNDAGPTSPIKTNIKQQSCLCCKQALQHNQPQAANAIVQTTSACSCCTSRAAAAVRGPGGWLQHLVRTLLLLLLLLLLLERSLGCYARQVHSSQQQVLPASLTSQQGSCMADAAMLAANESRSVASCTRQLQGCMLVRTAMPQPWTSAN